METNADTDSDEDDQHFSKLQRSATRNGFTARFKVALGLSLILVIIGLGLVGLSTSSLVTNLGCSALALNSACQPSSRPTTASAPTPTVPSTAAPTTTPTFMPSPTLTRGVAPSQAPTPTPILELTDQQVVTNTINHYVVLVVVDGAVRKAYNLLSVDLQANEPYNDFIQNANYTLKKGCWTTRAIHVSQRNSLTWDVGVELTQVSCVDTTPMAYYDWRFQVQKQYGLFVITSLGLYPTGSQNQ